MPFINPDGVPPNYCDLALYLYNSRGRYVLSGKVMSLACGVLHTQYDSVLTHVWCCIGTLDLHLRREKDFDRKLLKNVPRESNFCLSALRESQQHSDTVFSSGNNTVTKVTVI